MAKTLRRGGIRNGKNHPVSRLSRSRAPETGEKNPKSRHGSPTRLGRLSSRVRVRHSWRVSPYREYIRPRLECRKTGRTWCLAIVPGNPRKFRLPSKPKSWRHSSHAAVGYGISANWDSRGLQAFLRDRYQIILSRGGLRRWLQLDAHLRALFGTVAVSVHPR